MGEDSVSPSYEQLKRESKKGDGCNIDLVRMHDIALEKKLKDLEKTGVSKNDLTYQNIKSSITQFRTIPFRCMKEKTKYNKYGRISKMVFEQVK